MSVTFQNNVPATKLDWLSAVKEDLERVTEKIRTVSFLDNELLDGAVNMIIAGGGKRMRPAITLLVGRAVGADYDKTISVAASIELLHTATLVHDDLIDGAQERRGIRTLHSKLPMGVTVLTGDFLFAQSAALASEAENVEIVQTFSRTLVEICKGEILQAQTRWQIRPREEYNRRIYGKTAALFEAAAVSAAILGDLPQVHREAYATFGRELGMAFQIVDDALDFVSDTRKLGKPAGHDLQHGIITLPVFYYLEDNDLSPDDFLDQIQSEDTIDDAVLAVRDSGAPRKALEEARQYLQRGVDALDIVDWSEPLDDLMALTQYVATRDY
ncbi:MAG: polyprenyl synthetase family protein [Chloroflexi bacterium]|nr:polyprenyl synthetase family protein [Chloroflexota bacterium]